MLEILTFVAIWRLSYMLVVEDGPWLVFARIRDRFIDYQNIPKSFIQNIDGSIIPTEFERVAFPKNVIGEILNCIYCTSVWVAIPFVVLYLLGTEGKVVLFPIYWLSFSGLAIMLELVRRTLDKD